MATCVLPGAPRRAAGRAAGTRAARHRGGRDRVRQRSSARSSCPPAASRLWRAILERVPGSRLAFSPYKEQRPAAAAAPPRARRHLRPIVKVLLPTTWDEAKDRTRYAVIDIALDTMPYTGGDTTAAALDMGIPVVTRCGERHAERMSLQHPRAPRPHRDGRLHRRRLRGHRVPARDRSRLARRGGRRDPCAQFATRRARRSAALRALPRRRIARAPSPRRPAARPEGNHASPHPRHLRHVHGRHRRDRQARRPHGDRLRRQRLPADEHAARGARHRRSPRAGIRRSSTTSREAPMPS